MKKWFGLVTVVVLLVTLTNAPSATAFSGFVQWQDTKDMGSGFGVGLKHRFQIIPIVSVEGRASWISTGGEDGYETLNTFPLEVAGRAKLGLLYGGVGLGYYIQTGTNSPKNDVGGFLMGGAEFTLLGLGAYAELRYLWLEPDEDVIGGKRDLSGFGANVGIIIPIL